MTIDDDSMISNDYFEITLLRRQKRSTQHFFENNVYRNYARELVNHDYEPRKQIMTDESEVLWASLAS
jgi:hypothetical protein